MMLKTSVLFTDAKLGLVVPSYVTIDSITELNDHKDKFGSRIVGIEPGAGLMIHTERILSLPTVWKTGNL